MRIWMRVAALCLWPIAALADEVWETERGLMVYLSEQDDVAIWELEIPNGLERLYFPGLAGNFADRGVHDGFWIASTGPSCGSTLVGPDGHAGAAWGSVTLVFHDVGFPTNWTMLMGMCFGPPVDPLDGISPLLQ